MHDAPERVPSGAHRDIGIGQLFFSTTDRLGVIEQVNSVFTQISHFSRDELVGAAHNIIRHPAMPAGAFRLMWDALQDGRPFCAYVNNLAKDDTTYTVFATVTPVGDGYLSVRSRPVRTDLLAIVNDLYDKVRPQEVRLRKEGVSARVAAVMGAEQLAAMVAELGFASYDEFTWAALPAEVTLRTALAGELERHPASGDLADLQAASAAIHDELEEWLARMEQLQDLAETLAADIPAIRASVAGSSATAAEVTASLGGQTGFAPIMLSVNLWATMTQDILGILDDLVGQMEALRVSCAKTRFRIALARLHNDAVAQFVEELAVQAPGAEAARTAILDLGRALTEGVIETQRQMRANANLSLLVNEQIETAYGLLSMPQGLIANWRTMVVGRQDLAILRMLPTVEHQMHVGKDNLDRLSDLALKCRQVAETPDPHDLNLQLERILAGAAALA